MEVGEGTLQYVELGGVVGVFIELDASHVDEQRVETILKTAQNQIKVMVGAFKDGSNVQRDIYVRASEKKKKSSGCSCKYCDESFYCRLDLVAHQAKQHPQLPARSGRKAAKKCPNCGLLVQNLSLHIKLEHSQLLVYSDGLGFCRQCEQTYPLNTDHASACRFSPRCPDCKKTFSQWRGMIKHRKVVHMGEKIQCPTCKKTFHDSQSLKKHCEAVHMKLKRVCPLCGATVTCLSTHMNAVHADVRNFPCDMCEKKFKSKYDLTRHRNFYSFKDSVHLGNKAACPLCGKHISNLNQHIRIVHKQIKFPCTQCSKKYNTNSELQKHIKQAHPSSLPVDDIQTAARSSPEGLRLPVPESDLEFSQENNYHNNQQILQLTARENQQLQQQSRDNQQVQHQPRDNQQLLLQPRDNKQLSTAYEEESEDMMISQYMNKHPFSINSDEMKQDSVNDQLMASSVKDEQILSKHSIEYLPQSSRQEQRYIELRPMDEGRQLDLRQLPQHNDRSHLHHAHSDRLLHHDERLHGDRLHHAVIDDRLNPIGPSDDHIHDQVQHRLDQRHVAQDERQQHLELRLQHHPEDRHELEHDSNIHRVGAGGNLRAGDPGVLHPRLQNTYLTTHAGSRNLQDVSGMYKKRPRKMALRSVTNMDGVVDPEKGIFVEMEGVMEVRFMSGDDEILERQDMYNFQAENRVIPADFCHKNMETGEQALFFCLVCDCELKSIIPLKSHVEGAKHIRKAMAYKQRTLGCEPEPVNQPKKKKLVAPKARIDISKSLRERLEEYEGPIVGLEHIKEFADPRDKTAPLMYNCLLDGCKSAWGNSDDMFNHVKKEKHIRNYFRCMFPDDHRVNSQNKNDLFKKAMEFCVEQNIMQASARHYDEIISCFDAKEYREIATRPMDWSEKRHKFADRRGGGGGANNPNLTPLGYKDRGLFNEAKWKDFKAPSLQEVVDDLAACVGGEAASIEKMLADGVEDEIVLMEIDLSLDLIEYDLENHGKHSKLIEEDHTAKRKLLSIKERLEKRQQSIQPTQAAISPPQQDLTSSQQRQLERTTATEVFKNQVQVQVREIAEKILKGKAANDMDDIITKVVNDKIMPSEIQRFTKLEQKWREFKYTDKIRDRVTKFATTYLNTKYKAKP